MAFKKKFAPRRKFCRFCADKDLPLNYKRPDILRDFITERGKIIARRITGTCAHHQRLLTREIKRARQMALLIYTATHDSTVKKKICYCTWLNKFTYCNFSKNHGNPGIDWN